MNGLHTSEKPRSTEVSAEMILAELRKVTASQTLGRSERLCRFLSFVVQRTVDGKADDLKEYAIGVEVFEKGADFDPRLDSAVRVDARRLRAKLQAYYSVEGADDAVIISLPKGGYVPVFTQAAVTADEQNDLSSVVHARPLAGIAAGVALAVVVAYAWSDLRSVRDEDERLTSLVTQADYFAQRRTPASLRKAVALGEEAARTKPDFAPAYAVQADAYIGLADFEPAAEVPTLLSRVETNAQRALKLNSGQADALATLAALKLNYEWKWRESEELFRKSLSLNPNYAAARARYARLLSLERRHDEAIQHAQRAEMLAPLSVAAVATVGQAYYYAGRLNEALGPIRHAIELDPGYYNGRYTLARIHGLLGRHSDAYSELDRLPTEARGAEYRAIRGWLLAREGKLEEARRMNDAGATCISRAALAQALGDAEGAINVLEGAAASRDPNVLYVRVTPVLEAVRADARMNDVYARIGFR